MFRKPLALLTLTILGCATPSEDKADQENTLDKLRSAAALGYEYAQMAENTYLPHKTFSLPRNISQANTANDKYGLAYSVFERTENGKLSEVILSFRGTEGFKDWIYGNILTVQNRRGHAVYQDLRKKIPPEVPITVIGHSLGGAIALHISLREENVRTLVFNTSSRFTRGSAEKNVRHSYSEYAEANKILRTFTIDPKWTHSIYSCTFGLPIKNHAQDRLAACLTACAAQVSKKAEKSVDMNPKIFEDNTISDRACTDEE